MFDPNKKYCLRSDPSITVDFIKYYPDFINPILIVLSDGSEARLTQNLKQVRGETEPFIVPVTKKVTLYYNYYKSSSQFPIIITKGPFRTKEDAVSNDKNNISIRGLHTIEIAKPTELKV